ncbi:MAG: hypothetical protein ABIM99_03680 [Candidatus Dojkabacteria bacterium]
MKKIFSTLILLLLLIPTYKISAETGLQITPAVNNLIVKPGDIVTGSFKIINNNEFETSLEISKGLRNLDDTISLDNFSNTSIDWIKLDIDNITIGSQKEHVFNYTITIPFDTQEGVYRPMFVFKLLTSIEDRGAITSLSQLLPFQFGLFVSFSGKYEGDVQIDRFGVNSSVLVGTDQKIDFNIKNINISPAKPIIRIQIVSPKGDVIYQSVQNENLSFLFKDKPITNTLDASSAFVTEPEFGRYSVEILTKDTLTDKAQTAKVYFWFIPQNIIYIVVSILVLIGFISLFIFRFKKNKRKINKEDKHLFMYK